MGAKIKVEKGKTRSGELIGSIQVEYSKLKAINIPKRLSPYLIDEYPILSIAASVAKGTTKMNGLEELRYKESDRIKSIYNNLKRLKVNCSVEKDDTIESLKTKVQSLEGQAFIEAINLITNK